MTEQLLVLNYLIDILNVFNSSSSVNNDDNNQQVFVVINKNPRQSMFKLIRDYLYKIPLLNTNNILEMDFGTGEIFSFDSINNIYSSNNSFLLDVQNIYIGNAIKNNLNNIYQGWEHLHSRLVIVNDNIGDNENNENTDGTENYKNFYMSRRNLLDPKKRTNTRIMNNLEEVSNIINFKNFKEVYTDELKTLDDRINLFREAKNIVCELGAGMHNLLYCQDGINLFVMFQKNNYSWLQEYFPLFERKKMNVSLLVGETTSSQHNGNWLNTPWELPLTELNKIPSL